MSSAYDKIWAKVKRDAKKAQDMKLKMRDTEDIRNLIYSVLMRLEDSTAKSRGKMELAYTIEQSLQYLKRRLSSIDPNVIITIVWHKSDEMKEVEDLRIEAITIRWSDEYVKRYPEVPQEEMVSVEQLMLEKMWSTE